MICYNLEKIVFFKERRRPEQFLYLTTCSIKKNPMEENYV